jgi:hypothetical protein
MPPKIPPNITGSIVPRRVSLDNKKEKAPLFSGAFV